MALTTDERAGVSADFIRWLSTEREPTALSVAEIEARTAGFDDAIESFLAGVTDATMSERQLDWLLQRLATKRYEVKHG